MEPSERIFIYLRIRAGEAVVSRTKIRELRGLGGLLAELMAESVVARTPAEYGGAVRVEYVDAKNDEPLVSFGADRDRGELVVTGRIPAAYRERMLGRGADGAGISRSDFERRAGEKLGADAARELAEEAFRSQLDLMGLIERAIGADGRFDVRVPIEPPRG